MKQPDAQTAITTLSLLLDKTTPATLAFWVTPNTVLTLSGARAYCDGVFYSKRKTELESWIKEIANSIKIIETATDIHFAEAKIDNNGTEEYASYELITTQGLQYSFEQTHLLGPDKREILTEKFNAKQLNSKLLGLLKQNPDLKNLKKDSLEDIAFGILLGYPDEAILGSVDEWEKDDPFDEPLIDADIRGSWYYLCPRPVYSYPRHMVADPNINAHEQLWSTILKDFYMSDFHKNLAKNNAFHKKANRLEMLR